MSRSPYDASPRGPHPLSRANVGLVPRSLGSLVERHHAPFTPDTPNVDEVLLVTTASEVRRLQTEMETMRGQLAALRHAIKGLEGREKV